MKNCFSNSCKVMLLLLIICVVGWSVRVMALDTTHIGVKDDPLVRMPGTQPAPENNANIEAPTRCLNCHDGYNSAVEPGHNWQGSMMAQASRDFLFWACLTVSAQDSKAVIGRQNATDICIRCHFPQGWLEGRSDPTNASSMTGSDFDGVHCDVCHSMYDPFFEDTANGSREGNDWQGYWDETNLSDTPSGPAADATLEEDRRLSAGVLDSSGNPFFDQGNLPPAPWDENGSGQYFAADNTAKRGPFADANARHALFYSRYHKSKYMCSTCHDVSNPILANHITGGVGVNSTLADLTGPLVSESDPAYSFYHVERTFSEFMLSDYGQQDGAPGIGPFAPGAFVTSHPANNITKCQDCHMRDGLGKAASQRSAVNRPVDSIEHPESGQPIHDLTGGNAWVTAVLASTDPNCLDNGDPCYNEINDNLLNQGPSVLTLDLNQGQGIDPVRLIDASNRALEQLQLAAAINDAAINGNTLSFKVQNQTGHKLISGFPEGRRMFLNIRFYDQADQLVQEINPYDYVARTFKGFSYPYLHKNDGGIDPPADLDPAVDVHDDALIYEMKPSSTITDEDKTFHFALATGRYKDNRIPPKGFRGETQEAVDRISLPVSGGVEDVGYYTTAEYAGGYDEVSVPVPSGTVRADITLYYQTTSREYIEFLRDQINGTRNLTLPNGAADYIIQTDPWFANLAAWGDTIWELWKANMDLKTAAPYPMATASVGVPVSPCDAEIPVLDEALAASNQIDLNWSPAQNAIGYKLYYDQEGKSQFIADTGTATSFTDSGLTNGTPYCYKVTAYSDTCESAFSNVLCATPVAPGQSFDAGAVIGPLGRWEETGKGQNKVSVFVETTDFAPGDEVIMVVTVTDTNLTPLEGATVELAITGPVSATLTSGLTDVEGTTEVSWVTDAPNKKGIGGTPTGSYTTAVSTITVTGYTWDGLANAVTFTLN